MSARQSIVLLPHTHWDREWYEPFAGYQWRIVQVLEAVLIQLQSGALPAFTLDGQTAVLADVVALAPKLEAPLRAAIAQGKLQVGPWFVMPDEWLVSAESLVQNLRRGVADARAWGASSQDLTVGYLPDTFGHSGDMPALLASAGMTSAMVWRGISQERSLGAWQGYDGTRMPVWVMVGGYFQNAIHDPALTDTERSQQLSGFLNALLDATRRTSTNTLPLLLPVGGDHLGLPPDENWVVHLETQFKAFMPPETPLGTVSVGTLPAFMQQLKAATGDAWANGLPVLATGDLLDNRQTYCLHGITSSRLDLKRENRRLEAQLSLPLGLAWLQAAVQTLQSPHPISSGASVLQHVPHSHRELWRQLLLNQPHDSIGGCSVDTVHREMHTRYTHLAHQATRLSQTLNAIAIHPLTLLATPTTHPDALTVPILHLNNLSQEPLTGVVTCRAFARTSTQEAWLKQQVPTLKAITDNALWDDWHTRLDDVPQAHRTQVVLEGPVWVNDQPALAQSAVTLGIETPSSATRPSISSELPSAICPVTLNSTRDGMQLSNGNLHLTLPLNGQALQLTQPNQPPLCLSLVRFEDGGDTYTSAPTVTWDADALAKGVVMLPGEQQATIIDVQCVAQSTLEAVIAITWAWEAFDPAPYRTPERQNALHPDVRAPWATQQAVTQLTLRAGADTVLAETTVALQDGQQHWQWAAYAETPPDALPSHVSVWIDRHITFGETTWDPLRQGVRQPKAVAPGQEAAPTGGPIQRVLGWVPPSANNATDPQTGWAFLPEASTAYEIVGRTLRLSLWRGVGQLSVGDTGVRGGHAGPPLPTPEGWGHHRKHIDRLVITPLLTTNADTMGQLLCKAQAAMVPPSASIAWLPETIGSVEVRHVTALVNQPFVLNAPSSVVLQSLVPSSEELQPDSPTQVSFLLGLRNLSQAPVTVTLEASLPLISVFETDALGLPKDRQESIFPTAPTENSVKLTLRPQSLTYWACTLGVKSVLG